VGSFSSPEEVDTYIGQMFYTRLPDIHLTAPQEIQVNNFMHGVHAMPVAWTPPKSN